MYAASHMKPFNSFLFYHVDPHMFVTYLACAFGVCIYSVGSLSRSTLLTASVTATLAKMLNCPFKHSHRQHVSVTNTQMNMGPRC